MLETEQIAASRELGFETGGSTVLAFGGATDAHGSALGRLDASWSRAVQTSPVEIRFPSCPGNKVGGSDLGYASHDRFLGHAVDLSLSCRVGLGRSCRDRSSGIGCACGLGCRRRFLGTCLALDWRWCVHWRSCSSLGAALRLGGLSSGGALGLSRIALSLNRCLGWNLSALIWIVGIRHHCSSALGASARRGSWWIVPSGCHDLIAFSSTCLNLSDGSTWSDPVRTS